MNELIDHLEAAGLHPIIVDEHTEFGAPSPFLPGTNIQYAWDSTSLGYLKTCPQLYKYTMIDGWAPKDESIHLRFGIEYHKALEMYDRSRVDGLDHNDALRDVVHETLRSVADWDPDPTTKAGAVKNRRTLIRTIIWYLDKYQDDPAETFIKNDGNPAVELSFRFELDWGPDAGGYKVDKAIGIEDRFAYTPYLLCGHLDKVAVFAEELFVVDRKTTTSALSEYYFVQFEPNNQMTLYTLASKVVLNAPVKGVIIDAAQVTADYSKFDRRFTYRTPDQLEEWLVDLRQWLSIAERYAIDNYWPKNDTACDKYGGCRFRDICSKSPGVREKFLQANFKKQTEDEKWNPLKAR